MNKVSLVTGIWDLNRGSLSEGWSRNFDHYLDHFKKLMDATQEYNLIIFIDKDNENLVWDHRSKENTRVFHHSSQEFTGNFFPFYEKIQNIRSDENWLNITGWLRDSTQARLDKYNPMVMSKMFLLHNASIFNPFDSDYFYWIDGGITNTVHPGYFSHDKVLNKISDITNKFLFICFPYGTETDIHGFHIDGMKKFSKSDTVDRVARGGFFGGKKKYISEANNLYYSLVNDSLNEGYMGTEESIFTIMTYLDSNTFKYEMIEENGLISKFFEDLKNNNTNFQKLKKQQKHENEDILLYINCFNSPEQLQMVLNSFERYDQNFLKQTRKILLNNTTNDKLFDHYTNISKKYDIEEIRHGNKGICRSRQIAAEHFKASKSKYMIFFEDDMLLDLDKNSNCNFGFSKFVPNLFYNLIDIMDDEHYDFLKFSFSEFYGHNGEQWSWHNVPADRKKQYFGDLKFRPNTLFNHIKTKNNVPYAEGEVYYSNWPHIIGQEGNQKLFLDTVWENPFEQTWMSHIYTLSRNKEIQSAILLASPITHNRIHFYEASERREN